MSNKHFHASQVAKSTPFDNTGSGITATDTQAAILEVNNKIINTSKAFTFAQYNGSAGSGRYLEFFAGIDSSVAPIRVIGQLDIISIVARTTAVNATCTIGFYNRASGSDVLLYTLTFAAQKEAVVTGSPIFVVPPNGQLAIKIASGSITKPHLYFTGQGG